MDVSVKDIVNEGITPLGFEKRGLTWYRSYEEVVHVAELRKSRWGNFYHINLAVGVKKLLVDKHPKSRQCHLQAPLSDFSGRPDEVDSALNEEDYWKMDSEHRREVVKLALGTAELDFSRKLTSLSQVKQFLERKPSINLAISKSLKEIL
jgi:uncharacterized protein DUF4304